MIELSVVILGYRAEGYLKFLVNDIIKNFKSQSIDSYEIIIVANYDKDDDKTPIIAKQLAMEYSFIKSLTLKKEGKMGWDMRKGLDSSKGKYICVLDGDGQVASEDIVTVFNIIKDSPYDLVKTFRNVRYDGWWRILLSTVYNFLFNIIYRPTIKIKDVNAKPKIMTNQVYQKMHLQSNDWFTDAEIMIKAIDLKLNIVEVSTIFYKNTRRKSFISFFTIIEFVYNFMLYSRKK